MRSSTPFVQNIKELCGPPLHQCTLAPSYRSAASGYNDSRVQAVGKPAAMASGGCRHSSTCHTAKAAAECGIPELDFKNCREVDPVGQACGRTRAAHDNLEKGEHAQHKLPSAGTV